MKEIFIAACLLLYAGTSSQAQTCSGDCVMATLQNASGNGVVLQQVQISSSVPISGTLVPTSPAGSLGMTPLVTYNWYPDKQLEHFLLANPATRRIVTIGDSTTLGFGAASTGFRGLSYPAELAQALSKAGQAAEFANFVGMGYEFNSQGDEISDNRTALIGGAAWDTNAIGAGGPGVELSHPGDGVSLTLDTPGEYNQLIISYIDLGSGSITVAVDGGPVVATLKLGNTGNILTQPVSITAGTHSKATVASTTSTATYIQGIEFHQSINNASAAIEVIDAGIGGWTTTGAAQSYYNGKVLTASLNGFGQTAGSAALHPNLVLINLGINDILTGVPQSTSVANLVAIAKLLRSQQIDVVFIIPNPFTNVTDVAALVSFRASLESYAKMLNFPVIDLSGTYGDSITALSKAGLMASDNVHPNATLYADIATGIASLLKTAIQSQ
jgi:lysophospholipase L1-like esterase